MADDPRHAMAIQKVSDLQIAWGDLRMPLGTGSFRNRFKKLNETIIASGCPARIAIRPQAQQEIDAANVLTTAVMNGGTASTFLSFRC